MLLVETRPTILNSIVTELDLPSKQKIAEQRLACGDFIFDDIPSFIHSLSQSKFPEMLTPYALEEFEKMRLFLVRDMNIGFALKSISGGIDIVSVHNNEPGIARVGTLLMQQAILHGGTHVDHFGTTQLNNLYTSLGFDEYRREAYNPDYDPNRVFYQKYGPVPVIYRRIYK